jgi:hypothetical protein
MVKLPKFKATNHVDTYFVLVNSSHFMRVLIFDDEVQASYNHSSILTTVSAVNETLLEVNSDPQLDYDKRSL